MHAETTHKRPDITYAEMKTFLTIGWGELGKRVAEAWRQYNKTYFGNKLQPLPITIVNTSPHGHWLGLTTGSKRGVHLIQLTMPAEGPSLVADRGVLLHEMNHQFLVERGENPKHSGQPWCDQIMRLHYQITGKRLWVAPETVGKVKQEDGKRLSVRRQACCPETGEASIGQRDIASWPHSCGVKLGNL